MKGKTLQKLLCASLSAVMVCTSAASAAFAVPSASLSVAASAAASESTGKVIYSTSFEDDDVSKFSNRGENDTTELSTTTEFHVTGDKALLASGRSKDWNGPAFRLDEICQP